MMRLRLFSLRSKYETKLLQQCDNKNAVIYALLAAVLSSRHLSVGYYTDTSTASAKRYSVSVAQS